MRNLVLTICALILLISCRRNSHPEYAQQILGEWKLVAIVFKEKGKDTVSNDIAGHFSSKSGYTFLPNNECEDKAEFFNNTKKRQVPLNTHASYKIEDDSISIFNRADSAWQGLKIRNMINDTMYVNDPFGNLYHSSIYYKYVKQHYKTNPSFSFDEIILSSYSTWGLGHEIIINKSGAIVYCEHLEKRDNYTKAKISKNNKGEFIGESNGLGVYRTHQKKEDAYFLGNISNEKLKELTNNFQKADIPNLKTEYQSGGADGGEVVLTFVKDGKIIKTIHDYMEGGPAELIWAYIPLQYLPQQIKLDSVKSTPFQFPFRVIGFTIGKKEISLKLSESAYLLNLLRTAKSANTPFNKKYRLVFYDFGKTSKVATDGRYYEVYEENGSKKTYDIGFNFIERNASVLKFSNKTKDDE